MFAKFALNTINSERKFFDHLLWFSFPQIRSYLLYVSVIEITL